MACSSSSSSSSSLKTIYEHWERLMLPPCCTLLALSVLLLSAFLSLSLLKCVAAFFFLCSRVSCVKEPQSKVFAVTNHSGR